MVSRAGMGGVGGGGMPPKGGGRRLLPLLTSSSSSPPLPQRCCERSASPDPLPLHVMSVALLPPMNGLRSPWPADPPVACSAQPAARRRTTARAEANNTGKDKIKYDTMREFMYSSEYIWKYSTNNKINKRKIRITPLLRSGNVCSLGG